MDIKELDQLLTEPDISCMDWELGKSILANWKAGLPTRILAFIKEAGYVQLAEDQSHGGCKELIYAHQHNWRRICSKQAGGK